MPRRKSRRVRANSVTFSDLVAGEEATAVSTGHRRRRRRDSEEQSASAAHYSERVFATGDRYEGTYVDGLRDGHGTYVWAQTGDVYCGEWSVGAMHGEGEFLWASGARYQGTWSCGAMSGKGTKMLENGDEYEGDFVDGRAHGLGAKTYGCGDIHSGRYRNDQRCGHGTYRWSSGDVLHAAWRRGKLEGRGEMTSDRGDVCVATWRGDKVRGRRVAALRARLSSSHPRALRTRVWLRSCMAGAASSTRAGTRLWGSSAPTCGTGTACTCGAPATGCAASGATARWRALRRWNAWRAQPMRVRPHCSRGMRRYSRHARQVTGRAARRTAWGDERTARGTHSWAGSSTGCGTAAGATRGRARSAASPGCALSSVAPCCAATQRHFVARRAQTWAQGVPHGPGMLRIGSACWMVGVWRHGAPLAPAVLISGQRAWLVDQRAGVPEAFCAHPTAAGGSAAVAAGSDMAGGDAAGGDSAGGDAESAGDEVGSAGAAAAGSAGALGGWGSAVLDCLNSLKHGQHAGLQPFLQPPDAPHAAPVLPEQPPTRCRCLSRAAAARTPPQLVAWFMSATHCTPAPRASTSAAAAATADATATATATATPRPVAAAAAVSRASTPGSTPGLPPRPPPSFATPELPARRSRSRSRSMSIGDAQALDATPTEVTGSPELRPAHKQRRCEWVVPLPQRGAAGEFQWEQLVCMLGGGHFGDKPVGVDLMLRGVPRWRAMIRACTNP